MVNYGINLAGLLGIFYILLAVAYFILVIIWLAQTARRLNASALVLYIIQAIFAPILMFICGFILVFQGWRLDPILQFMQILLSILIIYLSIKDIVINAVYRNR